MTQREFHSRTLHVCSLSMYYFWILDSCWWHVEVLPIHVGGVYILATKRLPRHNYNYCKKKFHSEKVNCPRTKSHIWQSSRQICKTCWQSQQKGQLFIATDHIWNNVDNHPECFTGIKQTVSQKKPFTDNRRKTFAKPVKTIATKVRISNPKP